MRKVKVAQIGTSRNSHGANIFTTVKKLDNIFEIVGYALPENEREKFPDRMFAFEGYRELTVEEILGDPDIDAVIVETEEIYLTKYAAMAAKAGKHIHMEKPGTQDMASFEELINTVKDNKTVFHLGYMYRYNPCITELIDSVKRGELGEIISVEAQMNCCHPKEVREWLGTFKSGIMFFLGCHLVDLILQIQGKPKRIIPMNKSTGKDGNNTEDFGMAVFEYENGVSFAKTNASEIGGFARRNLVVTGSKKTVEIAPLEMFCENGKQYTEVTEYESDDWENTGSTRRTEPFDRYDGMMTSFANMVLGESKSRISYDYELELFKTLLLACGCDM